jgi:hypothetical protein
MTRFYEVTGSSQELSSAELWIKTEQLDYPILEVAGHSSMRELQCSDYWSG